MIYEYARELNINSNCQEYLQWIVILQYKILNLL